ncbi:hypothetical protein UVI_02058760 [Ustilaginoidea virens]|nr:hypothetical protein UVI_02058760 [Ustilaginoidea virens]
MAQADISPGQIGLVASRNPVRNPYGPAGCYCGWYLFYSSVCGHLFQKNPEYCGQKLTKLGRSGFCTTPAPQNHMTARVGQACPQCRR